MTNQPTTPGNDARLAYVFLSIKEGCAAALERASETFEDENGKAWLQAEADNIRRRTLAVVDNAGASKSGR